MSEAWDYIGGYTLANDFALHDFRDADRGAMLRVKGADTLGVVGPGLVRGWTPGDQVLRTRVNGKVVQESSLKGMIWDMAYLVTDLALVVEVLATARPHDRPLVRVQAGDRLVEVVGRRRAGGFQLLHPVPVVQVRADDLGRLHRGQMDGLVTGHTAAVLGHQYVALKRHLDDRAAQQDPPGLGGPHHCGFRG